VVVKNTWEDPVFTPTAIARMLAVREKGTTEEDKTEAAKLKKELSDRYPQFQLPK
jgi:hypothetical protein